MRMNLDVFFCAFFWYRITNKKMLLRRLLSILLRRKMRMQMLRPLPLCLKRSILHYEVSIVNLLIVLCVRYLFLLFFSTMIIVVSLWDCYANVYRLLDSFSPQLFYSTSNKGTEVNQSVTSESSHHFYASSITERNQGESPPSPSPYSFCSVFIKWASYKPLEDLIFPLSPPFSQRTFKSSNVKLSVLLLITVWYLIVILSFRENSSSFPLHLRTSSCRVWRMWKQAMETYEYWCGSFWRSSSWWS